MSYCRDCQATIRFVVVDTGKAIPVNPHGTHHEGNIAARSTGTRKLVGYRITKDRPLEPGFLRYVPHRATCRNDKPRVLAKDRTPTLLDP